MASTSVLSSPSPTLSPKPSFSSDVHHRSHNSSLSSLRRSGSHRSTHAHYRLSPSASSSTHHAYASSSHASSPASSVHTQQTPTSAPKRRAVDSPPLAQRAQSVDVGTQYTPPEYPPTSRRAPMSPPAAQNLLQNNATPTPRNTARAEMEEDVAQEEANRLVLTESHSPPPPEPTLRQDPRPHTPTGEESASGSAESGQESSAQESPVKRARGEAELKVMPLDYMKCDVRDLGIVIADMLMELLRINDPLPVRNEQLTRYHSRAPPAISIHDYLTRLIIHATLSPPILLSLVYYIDKLSALYPIFNISSLTVHRYLITAATVAAKGLSDSFWTNNTYAKVGGISVKELALLELDFLERMDWKIVPPADVLVDYYRNLVERSGGYVLETSGGPEG